MSTSRVWIKAGLLFASTMSLTALAEGGFSDIDIRQITQAAAAAMPGAIVRFDEAQWAGCPNTSEDHCSREAVVLIQTTEQQRPLIVSNVSGGWIVSQKQQAVLAKERLRKEQDALNDQCEREWKEAIQPGHSMEHWTWAMYWQWRREHCQLATKPPAKPVGMDSRDNGK